VSAIDSPASKPTQSSDAQRQAQSAAAIYKLKQQISAKTNSEPDATTIHEEQNSYSSPSSPPKKTTTTLSSSKEKKIDLELHPTKAISPTTNKSPKETVTVQAVRSNSTSTKPILYVDTGCDTNDRNLPESFNVAEDEQRKSPELESHPTRDEPLWNQSFPVPSVSPHESQALGTTPSHIGHVFSPFGIGFDGGIQNKTVQDASTSSKSAWSFNASAFHSDKTPVHNNLNGNGNINHSDSSSSFASVDAAFTQRNESSEALAGLLGVQLSSKPLIPISATSGIPSIPKSARSSRFSFANKPQYNNATSEVSPTSAHCDAKRK